MVLWADLGHTPRILHSMCVLVSYVRGRERQNRRQMKGGTTRAEHRVTYIFVLVHAVAYLIFKEHIKQASVPSKTLRHWLCSGSSKKTNSSDSQ